MKIKYKWNLNVYLCKKNNNVKSFQFKRIHKNQWIDLKNIPLKIVLIKISLFYFNFSSEDK